MYKRVYMHMCEWLYIYMHTCNRIIGVSINVHIRERAFRVGRNDNSLVRNRRRRLGARAVTSDFQRRRCEASAYAEEKPSRVGAVEPTRRAGVEGGVPRALALQLIEMNRRLPPTIAPPSSSYS